MADQQQPSPTMSSRAEATAAALQRRRRPKPTGVAHAHSSGSPPSASPAGSRDPSPRTQTLTWDDERERVETEGVAEGAARAEKPRTGSDGMPSAHAQLTFVGGAGGPITPPLKPRKGERSSLGRSKSAKLKMEKPLKLPMQAKDDSALDEKAPKVGTTQSEKTVQRSASQSVGHAAGAIMARSVDIGLDGKEGKGILSPRSWKKKVKLEKEKDKEKDKAVQRTSPRKKETKSPRSTLETKKKRRTIDTGLNRKEEFVDTMLEYLFQYAGVPGREGHKIRSLARKNFTCGGDNDLDEKYSSILLQNMTDYVHAWHDEEQERRAATIIQANVRGWIVRQRLGHLKDDPLERERVHKFALGVRDLYSKEMDFKSKLETVVIDFLLPIRMKPHGLTEENISTIFANIDTILKAQCEVVQPLAHLLEDWPLIGNVGQVYLKHASAMIAFGTYVSNFNNSQAVIARVKSENTAMAAFLQDVERRVGASLSSLLTCPLNHISRICGILNRLLDHAESESDQEVTLQHACGLMSEASNWVNQELLKCDSSEAIMNVQRKIIGGDKLGLVTARRRFEQEGDLQVTIEDKKPRSYHVFLFNDMLLLTKQRARKSLEAFQLVEQVKLRDITLDSVRASPNTNPPEPLFFFCVGADKKYTLEAATVEARNQWKNLLIMLITDCIQHRAFGVSISDLLKREDNPKGLPSVIVKCVDHIKAQPAENGLGCEGMFRIPGDQSKIAQLMETFNLTDPKEYKFPDKVSTHDVAGLLKLWFRMLPDPLLGFEVYDDFLAIYAKHKEDKDEFVREMKELLKRVPADRTRVLSFFLHFLSQVCHFSDLNKMSPSNLAIVFGPVLVRPQVESIESSLQCPLINCAVAIMIERYFDIFPRKSSRRYSTAAVV